MSDHDERVQQVIDELDPTPAHEGDWSVSRRQTLRALAAAGLLGAGAGSASAQSAGGVIADEANLANYGSESVSDGWELTIDDDVFALTASEDTIGLPDGGVGEEVVTPSGGGASEIVAPDGTVVFDSSGIPDSAIHRWPFNEGDGTTTADSIGDADATINGATWVANDWAEGFALEGDGIDDYLNTDPLSDFFTSDNILHHAVAFTIQTSETLDTNTRLAGQEDSASFSNYIWPSNIDDVDESRVGLQIQSSVSGAPANAIQTDEDVDDGQKRRIVVNVDGEDVADWELYINGTESGEVAANEISGSDVDGIEWESFANQDMHFFAWNSDGEGDPDNHFEGVLDDIILCNSPLSTTDIQADYDRQPWS